MIAAEFLGPPDLARTQTLCIHEMTKVVMISKNENLVFAIFLIMPACFKGLNNGQKLTIVNFVSSFGRNDFMQEVGHRMLSARDISQQTQHSTNSMPRGISFNQDVLFRIEMLKDWRFSKGLT